MHAIGDAAGDPSGGFLSYEYFNSLALTFTMSQAWLNPSVYTDYRSKITFTGISGSDNGGVHQYYLTSHSLNAEDITSLIVDNSAFPGSASPLVDGTTYNILFHIYDEAGNLNTGNTSAQYDPTTAGNQYPNSLYSGRKYDTTAPRIQNITTDEGASPVKKKIGDDVNFTVYFSEYVTASSNVVVTFETTRDGTESIPAWGAYGSPTTAKLYRTDHYTIEEGDASDNLAISSISSPNSIQDRAGNYMTDFSIVGNNLDDISYIQVDGVYPSITKVTANPSDGALAEGEPTDITVELSEEVTLTGSIKLVLSSNTSMTPLEITTLSTGLVGGVTVSSGTVTYTPSAGDLEITDLDVSTISFSNGGKFTDTYGNAVTSITGTIPSDEELRDNASLTVETVDPVISSITTTHLAGTYGVDATIPITLLFKNGSAGGAADEPLTLTGTGTINVGVNNPVVVNNGTGTFSAAVGNTVTGGYTVASGDVEGNISVESVTLVGVSTLTDAAGNGADLTMPGALSIFSGKTITIDRTPPFLQSITTAAADGTYKIGQSINILLNFDDKVLLAGGNMIVTLNTAPTVATISVPAVSPAVATMTATYLVAENQSVDRLDITSVALDPSASPSPTLTDITDWAADNTTYYPNDIDPTAGFIPVTAFSTGNYNLKIDGTYPAIASVTSSTPDDTYGIGDDIILTLTFSELVISNNILELPFGLTNNLEFPALAGDGNNDPVGDEVTVTYTISTGHVGAVHRSLNSFIFAEFYLTLLGDIFVDP